MTWSERIVLLEKTTGKSINEMLGRYVELWISCEKCPIKDICNKSIDCDIMWKAFLEGRYDL